MAIDKNNVKLHLKEFLKVYEAVVYIPMRQVTIETVLAGVAVSVIYLLMINTIQHQFVTLFSALSELKMDCIQCKFTSQIKYETSYEPRCTHKTTIWN